VYIKLGTLSAYLNFTIIDCFRVREGIRVRVGVKCKVRARVRMRVKDRVKGRVRLGLG
jgi:hypothetical protein